MHAERPLSRRQNLGWGLALIALSFGLALLIYLEPQKLHAPAWVAYTAAGAFLVAGLLLLATAAQMTRVQNWLAVALVLALVIPGGWVAFGPGERQCIAALPFFQLSSEAVCRAGFGLGTLLGVGILLLYIRHALGRKNVA